MSALSEMYEQEKREDQRIMDTWANYNDKNEELLAQMEKQVESDEWRELHGH